jgi:hypothetical protein
MLQIWQNLSRKAIPPKGCFAIDDDDNDDDLTTKSPHHKEYEFCIIYTNVGTASVV